LNGVHLACLSGDNGAGKSALLDAMTWALWGEARVNADNDIMAQNETEMAVDFEFAVGEQRYRVDRKHSRKGSSSGTTRLFFYIWNGHEWRDASGSGVRDTQKQLTATLHMTYKIFINSAFLKQGKADEFTSKSSTERKDVLAEILELSRFDELEKKAKEQAKEADSKLKELKFRLGEIDQEINKQPAFEAQREEIEIQLQQCREQLFNFRQNLLDMRSDEARLKQKEEELSQNQRQVSELQKRLAEVVEEQTEAHLSLAQCQKVLSRREEIQQGYVALQKINEALEAFGSKAERHINLERQEMRLQNLVSQERGKLENKINFVNKQIDDKQSLTKELGKLESDFSNLKKELDLRIVASEDFSQKQAEAQNAEAEIKLTEGELIRLKKEMAILKDKAENVPPAGGVCDRCGTLLTEQAREQTLGQYRDEYKLRLSERSDFQKTKEDLQANLDGLRQAIKSLEKPARERSGLEKQAGTLEEKLNQARKAEEDLLGLQGQRDSLSQDLNLKQYAVSDQHRLTEIQGEIAALHYDQKLHEAAKGRKAELRQFEDLERKLHEAEKDALRAERDLARLAQEHHKVQTEIGEGQAKLKRLQTETAGLAQLRARIATEQQSVNQTESQEKLLSRNLGKVEADIENCEKRKLDKEEKLKQYAQAAQSKDIYGELSEAFGKKGLQALVIDTVLPELEEETNRLLGDMSDGRMSVRFGTQKDRKKGEPMEVLELVISDEQGSRPYECFSGGEAFRINFAVRIALSKLLARRSGAQLRTLIIDEGFGSQDGQGRERLVEAILGIEKDFERVLVITHLQELKDVFPVRIDVVKTASGSQISVN